jgi:TPR repeat protein
MAEKYERGFSGIAIDEKKALELYLKAVELGHHSAPNDMARNYQNGSLRVQIDHKKAKEYLQLAASRGLLSLIINWAVLKGVLEIVWRQNNIYLLLQKWG